MDFFRKYFFALLLVLFSLACEEQEIEPQHYMVASVDAALFNINEDFGSLREKMYEDLNLVFSSSDYQALQNLPSLGVSVSEEKVEHYLIDTYHWQADNLLFNNVWRSFFSALSDINYIIDELSNTYRGYDQAEELLLEARFIRALYMFEHAIMFGQVALPISPINNVSEISDVEWVKGEKIWTFLIDELNVASLLTKEKSKQFKPNYWAVKALLGKIHLYKANKGDKEAWIKAYRAFSDILNSGQFILEKQYANLFEPDLLNDIESLFYTQLSVAEPTLKFGEINSYSLRPSLRLPSLFSDQDNRLATIIEEAGENEKAFKKYNSAFYQGEAIPFYVVRLADIWLLHSEIIQHILPGDRARLTGINLVRERSKLQLISNEVSDKDFLMYIQQEREKELILEAKSLYDYRRWGLDFMKSSQPEMPIQEKHLVFPIPNAVLADDHLNVYEQHQGY